MASNESSFTTCSICMENYEPEGDRKPKLLPCSHTFCVLCLWQMVESLGSRIKCPMCRKDCLLPESDPTNFPTNR